MSGVLAEPHRGRQAVLNELLVYLENGIPLSESDQQLVTILLDRKVKREDMARELRKIAQQRVA